MTTLAGLLALSMVTNGDDPLLDRQFAHVKSGPAKISSADEQVAQASGTTVAQGQSSTAGFPVVAQGHGATSGTIERARAPIAAEVPVQSWARTSTSNLRGLKDIKGMSKVVNVNFENKTASDVLKWMSKQGVNFAVNLDNLPKNRISLHMTNAPLHEVLLAVSDVLGGQWSLRNNTLIFNQGRAFRAFTPRDGFTFEFDVAPGMTFVPDGAVPPHVINPGEFEKFNKELKIELDKAKGLHEKAMKDHNIALETHEKALKELRLKELPKIKMEMENFRLKELPKIHGELAKVRAIRIEELKNFVKSITQEQKESMKTRGYIKISELTDSQLKFLKIDRKEDHSKSTFQFDVDGEKIVIKDK